MAIENLFLELSQMSPKDLRSRPKVRVEAAQNDTDSLNGLDIFINMDVFRRAIADVYADSQVRYKPASAEQ